MLSPQIRAELFEVTWTCHKCGLQVESAWCPVGWEYEYHEYGGDNGVVTDEADTCQGCLLAAEFGVENALD